MPYETPSLIAAGVVLAVIFWRTPTGLMWLSGSAALLLALFLVALAFSGWPLFRARMHQRPASTANAELHQMHSCGGHVSFWLMSLVTPSLFAAALRRPSSAWRRATHVGAVLLVVAGWLLVGVTGYFLPDNLPNPLPPDLAPTVFRFAVLHMLGMPTLMFIALTLIGWRHLRLARARPQPLPSPPLWRGGRHQG